MFKFVLLCVLTLCSAVVIADPVTEDLYQIDVIIFEHNDPKRFKAEQWPNFIAPLELKNTQSLATTDTLVKVEANQRLLNSEAGVLRRSKDQRVIEQLSWRQVLPLNAKQIPVYIQCGKDDKEIEALISVKPLRTQFEVSVDAIYHDQADSREFRITRDIKTKKKEMFYLDHPIIGMMVMVSPVTPAS